MVVEKLSLTQKPILTLDDFLSFYDEILYLDPQDILSLSFDISKERNFQKLSPEIQIAEPKDAEIISNLFKTLKKPMSIINSG